jgi:hypothetical protein
VRQKTSKSCEFVTIKLVDIGALAEKVLDYSDGRFLASDVKECVSLESLVDLSSRPLENLLECFEIIKPTSFIESVVVLVDELLPAIRENGNCSIRRYARDHIILWLTELSQQTDNGKLIRFGDFGDFYTA